MRWSILLSALAVAAAAWGQAAEPSAPATVDHVRDLLDDYTQGNERTRFFAAAGVDGELARDEFEAVAGQAGAFARSYDSWAALLVHDADANGTIDWVEAEQYRQALQNRILTVFDKDGDHRLTGQERTAANASLSKGAAAATVAASAPAGGRQRQRPAGAPEAGGEGSAATSAPAGRQVSPDTRARIEQAREEFMRRYDTDGDGKLSEEERQAVQKDMKNAIQAARLKHYDTNGDGRVDEQEQAAADEAGKRAEQARQDWIKKYDTDGDGKINKEEYQAVQKDMQKTIQAARLKHYDTNGDGQIDEQEEKAAQSRQRWAMEQGAQLLSDVKKRYDADGDGTIDPQEAAAVAKAYHELLQRRFKEADADGDGIATPEEVASHLQRLKDKYDADGDGQLNDSERQKLLADQLTPPPAQP